ncbi:choice-of-anchor Q domain-containing protein [Gimesia fumaroli]|uniref:Probable pectate lyase C n=1 Tax=Gimesia fumaroli TaxID=2527976 RepID=A0A518IKM2_9PLAN|nr:choice-of-anchor Q domain-containing protein [Gimesia fumaroli]QDV53624.1 putative outer membrane protein PmpG precursor [Gimesia fumaroli]
MFSSQWLSSLKNQLRVRSSRRKHRARRHQAPFSRALVSRNAAESLEDRTLLTVFTVVNTDDSGEGSLRDAIEQANASAGADTISFDASLADQTIQLMNQLRITDDLTIIGLGSDQLTIDANHTGRIFDVYDGTHSANLYVSISGLTLANGDANVLPNLENTTPSIGLGGNISYKRYNTGGAIFNYEHLSVSDLVFQDNQARLGGAISSQSGAGATMSIENSVFLRNTASAGGAIYSRSSVTVTGSSFVENQATGDGGAIYASSLTVSGSSFTENSAQGSGGAIYHPYGELQVADSTFTGNVAGENGGGIYHNYRKVWNWGGITIPDGPDASMRQSVVYLNPTEITNCEFIENSATLGGALYSVERIPEGNPVAFSIADPNQIVGTGSPYEFENSFDPQVILNDCFFKANTAELGGAILNRSGSIQIVDSTFAENTVTHSGGALYNYGNLVMEDSTLNRNSANSGGGVYNTGNFKLIDGYFLQNHAASTGGAVASSLAYIRVNETYFGSNSAGQMGGGIYLVQGNRGSIVDDMGEILSNPSPLIENSIFNRNTAGNGGGIYNSPWMADIGFQTLNVLNSTFYHNEATQSGGGIYNGRTQLSISGSDFSQNQAIDGAGINNLGGSVFIEESTLSENIATGSGGAIATLGHLSLFNSTLSGNQAALAGGGIYHRNGAEFSPDGTEVNLSPIDPSQFPIVDPGLQLLPANPPQILDLIFVVSLNGVIDTTLPINDNDSDVPADSVPLWLLNSSLDVVNSSLVGNTAGASGGGISTPEPGSRSTTTVKNSIVAGNAATAGSQIAGEFTAQTNIIQDSIEDLIDPVLRDNGGPTKTHALLPGSIAINAGSNEIVENADLMTDQRGAGFERIIDGTVDIGAFELHSMTFVVDTNSDIDDGDYSSGQLSLREAIRLSNENPSDIDQITFDASLAGQTIVLSGELEIRDSVLITGLGANLLTLDGNQNGRIFNIHGFWTGPMRQVVIDGLTLTNGVDMSGGAIYTDKILTVRDCLITHNHSTRSGGGIYSEYELNVINTTFLLNSAALSGGAIKAGDHRTTITGSSFERNTAQSGGAFSASQFYIRGPKVSISDSTFFENSASSAGGAIYIYEGTLTIEDSEISKNTTSQWGAGVYSEHAAISITGSTLAENLAVVNGGGVYLLDGSLNLRESTLSGNFAGSTGGGIHSTGDLTIYNSTISGNTTNGFGGGVYQTAGLGGPTEIEFYSVSTADFIYYRETPNELTIVNSTITGNHAAISAGGIFSSAETFELANSIVAGNSAAGNAQISGVYSSGINIIQDSIEGVLAPVLRDNGGPTKTHALLAGSAAINGGDNAAAEAAGLMNDQRGDGSSRIVDGTVDIGAFEVQAPLAQIDLRVVKSKTPTSGNGESASLPENITWIDEWGNYWVEIWISTADTTDLGIMSANLDLTYNTEITTATSIEYGAAFTENQTGTINDQTGTIENLSAETSLTNVGDDQRVLFARIKFESTTDDAVDLDLEGQSLNAQSLSLEISQPQILLADHTASDVIYGLAPATQIWANPYDFNDDDAINVADLKILISTYHSVSSKSNSPHKWITDLNRNDRVDLRDLILFVRNFGKDKADRSQNYFPENFIELWFDHLIVDSQSEVQANAHPVTQSAAETVLESVVEQVSPQLTPSQNETLAQVDIEVVDLAGETLGRAVPGTIYIDVNAAGRGWFVDASPADHSEFTYDSELTLIALPDSSAAGQVDLFTVILHELGHLLGYEHETDGVMQETLVPGVRRLPDWADETDSFFSTLSGESELLPF